MISQFLAIIIITSTLGAPTLENGVQVSFLSPINESSISNKNRSVHVEFRDAKYPPDLKKFQQLQHVVALKMFLKALELPKIFGDPETLAKETIALNEVKKNRTIDPLLNDYVEDGNDIELDDQFHDASDLEPSQGHNLAKESVNEADLFDQAFADASSTSGPSTSSIKYFPKQNPTEPEPDHGFLSEIRNILSTTWKWITSPFSS